MDIVYVIVMVALCILFVYIIISDIRAILRSMREDGKCEGIKQKYELKKAA